jgi:RsiW-degrading membrane proteinase PrsW (M82 family)
LYEENNLVMKKMRYLIWLILSIALGILWSSQWQNREFSDTLIATFLSAVLLWIAWALVLGRMALFLRDFAGLVTAIKAICGKRMV